VAVAHLSSLDWIEASVASGFVSRWQRAIQQAQQRLAFIVSTTPKMNHKNIPSRAVDAIAFVKRNLEGLVSYPRVTPSLALAEPSESSVHIEASSKHLQFKRMIPILAHFYFLSHFPLNFPVNIRSFFSFWLELCQP
jgi:hypothetical protein